MEDKDLRVIAAQLRKPEGEAGSEVAVSMNQGNAAMNLHTLAVLRPEAWDHVLEIGMGNGYFVKNILLYDDSIKYTGCDYSSLMVKEAEQNNAAFVGKGRAHFVQGSITKLPFEDKRFSKVFTVNTIYFWEDTRKALNELKRVLAPGGVLILSIRPKHIMEALPVTKFGFAIYSKAQVVDLLTTHGFVVKSITEVKEPEQTRGDQTFALESLIIESIVKST